MKKKMLNIRKFKNSNEGVAGIVIAVLLTGLLISSIAIIQATHVPNWMEKKEAEHMNAVKAQLSQLKFTIDTLSFSKQEKCPVAVPITLGSDEMPVFSSMRAHGSIDISNDECKITIEKGSPPLPLSDFNELTLGSIKYSSSNAYYHDQSYIYENGALILQQESKNVMIVKPAISLIGGKNISFNLISINGIGQKIAYGSYDTSMVQVEFMEDKYDGIISDIDILTIHTSYKNAWYGLFKTLMDSPRANSDLKDNYAIIDTVDNEITLDFSSCSDKPDLYLNIVEIGAQISPGWIE